MRDLVIDTAKQLGMAASVCDITLDQVREAESLFVTNSLTGIRPVRMLESRQFKVDLIPAQLIDRVMDRGFSHA